MFKYFNLKNSFDDISNKLDNNETVCKEMLKLLNNNSSTVKIDEDINNSYYVFLNDTIYLSNKEKTRTGLLRICNVAHECIHAIQNKTLQIINFVLSNAELVLFIVAIILIVFNLNIKLLLYCYLITNVTSTLPRLILEIDAVVRSIILAKKYLNIKLTQKELDNVMITYKNQIILMFPLFVLSLLFGRAIRFCIIYFAGFIL